MSNVVREDFEWIVAIILGFIIFSFIYEAIQPESAVNDPVIEVQAEPTPAEPVPQHEHHQRVMEEEIKNTVIQSVSRYDEILK